LRKLQVIDGYESGARDGTFWGIRGHVADDPLADPLSSPPERTAELAAVKTRLAGMPSRTQERLINWGYAICDAAMRSHVVPGAFPYPGGVG
jgi:NTE family protein